MWRHFKTTKLNLTAKCLRLVSSCHNRMMLLPGFFCDSLQQLKAELLVTEYVCLHLLLSTQLPINCWFYPEVRWLASFSVCMSLILQSGVILSPPARPPFTESSSCYQGEVPSPGLAGYPHRQLDRLHAVCFLRWTLPWACLPYGHCKYSCIQAQRDMNCKFLSKTLSLLVVEPIVDELKVHQSVQFWLGISTPKSIQNWSVLN